MNPRLGVNIDHVATLRQARGEEYPSIARAAETVLKAGADQITIHLREDRRHIQDTDVEVVQLMTKQFGKPLNLEMGCAPDIVDLCITVKPDWVCLVPEKREEKTTEGGLDLLDSKNFERVKTTCEKIKKGSPESKISLFLEANISTLEKASELSIDAVEIHTGDYARKYLEDDDVSSDLTQFKKAYELLTEKNIAVHAGHGLTIESVLPLLKTKLFAEYNIGHWIICESVFKGLSNVILDFKALFAKEEYQV